MTVYCFAQPYNIFLVLLAIVVCLTASSATFTLYPRAIAEGKAGKPPLWTAVTAMTGASAVWATHFTAMLAFNPSVDIGYTVPATVASFAVATIMTASAFLVATRFRHLSSQVAAGVMLGLATATMHYTGVSGMEVAGRVLWDEPTILWSIFFSVAFSVLAILACGTGSTFARRQLGALAFGASIAALHFTGMAAITIIAEPLKALPRDLLTGTLLGVAVGAVTLLVIACSGAAKFVDRRARRESDAKVRFLARHDMLTSLPNRVLFEDIMGRELTETAAEQRSAAVLCLDLDGFKEVNDIFGHAAGDALLIEVAQRLQDLLGERCVAARLGGDEFAILATGLNKSKTAGSAAQSVLDVLSAPFEIGGSKVHIGCSIGIALFPGDGVMHSPLLARADIALSRAKADGRGVFRYFEKSMDDALRERRLVASELRNALALGQLNLVYQPQVDLIADRITGFEALVRWAHPSRGSISPEVFIPIAEETGLILPLGEWVMREACREAASWEQSLSVAVNLSVAQFRQSDLLQMIEKVLRETGLPAERLEIEITESLFFDSVPRTLLILQQIKALGVRVAIDDFGTGYSSLSTLQAFPFDKMKIDRSFTNKIGSEAKGTAIVGAILGLGNALGITVIAEGVETEAQADFLRRQQCEEVQGYFFGKPLRIESYSHYVKLKGHALAG